MTTNNCLPRHLGPIAGLGLALACSGCSGASGDGLSDAARDAASDAPISRDSTTPEPDAAGDRGGGDATTDAQGASPMADAGTDGGPMSAGDAGPRGCADPFGAGPAATTTTHLDIPVHDPSMFFDGSRFYLFATGGLLSIRSSPDILTWSPAGTIFSAVPAWITAMLGTTPTDLWAPDISYLNGQFRVYYAGSSFGSNTSVIGLATSPTLDPRDPTYGWTDQGLVVHSVSSDDFNAIDPSVAFDQDCAPWLVFGSFWSGIKLRKLDAPSGMPAGDDTTLHSLASRDGGAIEAPSIISHDGFFYLFVSFDFCCRGTASTYRTMVGRASSITGPYTDKAGNDMMTGAAEQLLAGAGRYIGPGGGTAFAQGNGYLYAYHYYDGDDGGASKLQVRPVAFGSDDWPTLGDPLFP
jgi:arabinan endo-1,5-alpha-L-arabinosidase